MSRAFLLAILIAFWGENTGALDIHLAPIVYHDESGAENQPRKPLSEDILLRLAKAELSQQVNLRKVEGTDQSPPESFLDAARLCEAQGYAYLLYGYAKRTTYSYYAEVKLFSREQRDVASAFIASDDYGHYERFIDDLSAKIAAYIRDELGFGAPRQRVEPARNILTLPVTVGYWTPMDGAWNAALTGLVSADLGIRFVPSRELFHLGNRPGFFAFGLDAEYNLGMNKPGLEAFFLHTVRLRLPFETFLDLGDNHGIGLGVGAILEIDTMLQSRLYDSTLRESTITPGVSFSLLYQYALSDSVSVGLANILDVAFYAQPLVTFSPRLFVDFRVAGRSESSK